MGGQGAEGIDLLGDLHRAELGGHRGADPAGNHQRSQHRTQLPAHGHADDRHYGTVHFDLMKLDVKLGAHHHAGESPGEQNHGLGLDADEVNLLDEIAHAEALGDDGAHGLPKEVGEACQTGQGLLDRVVGSVCHALVGGFISNPAASRRVCMFPQNAKTLGQALGQAEAILPVALLGYLGILALGRRLFLGEYQFVVLGGDGNGFPFA